MSGLDVGFVLLALLGAFLGTKIGVVSAGFNILGGFLGSWAAARFHIALARFMPENPSAAYLLVFAAVAGACVAAGILLSHLLEDRFLGLADRFFGALLGMALSLMLAAVSLLPALVSSTPSPSMRDMLRRSAFAPYLVRLLQRRLHVVPAAVWQEIEPRLESDDLRRVRRLLEARR